MQTTDGTTPPLLPIGSVICFGGDLSQSNLYNQVKTAGWLLCDGTDYKQSDFPALFAAIGTANGSSAGGHFNVPDLRDRFVRGRNGTVPVGDPDAGQRPAANLGGAAGNAVGSLQLSATALPTSKPFAVGSSGTHTHNTTHLSSDMHQAWGGSTYDMARWNAPATTDAGGAHSHTVSGFDAVTSPVNVSLYFIIKANEPSQAGGTLPAGSMVGFAGASSAAPAKWLACDGMSYGTTRFPNLNLLISYNYGGDGVSVFNVPDLRGQFVRGTSHSTGRDPDAASRFASDTGGGIGDATGSGQSQAMAAGPKVAIASGGEHDHNIALIPLTFHNVAAGASGPAAKNVMHWTNDVVASSSGGDHSHSIIGGDHETRPANVYLDWLIASDNLAAAPPIGSIMPIGSDTTNLGNFATLVGQGWLPCSGAKLTISDPQYAALYSVIGETYGSVPLQFLLPDLRGYFVQGAGGQAKVGALQAQSLTGVPVAAITTSTDGSHTHVIQNIPTDTHEIDVVMGYEIAENNSSESPTSTDGAHTHTLAGGDNESRPVNVYVDYVIRFK